MEALAVKQQSHGEIEALAMAKEQEEALRKMKDAV